MPDQPGPRLDAWGIEAMLTAIVQSADDAIVSKDLNGIVTSWNPAAERIFGYTAEEMIGQPIVRIVPPERPNEEPAILARLRQGERVEHFETVRVRKDGRRIDVSVTISPIRNPEGKVIGASKIARDITGQRLMALELQERAQQIQQQNEELEMQYEELAAQNQELLEADRQKNQFLAMLAHELRNPLTPIVNAVHLLRARGDSDPTLVKNLDVLARQSRQMSRLLDDLLEVSRVTRGMVSLRSENVDLVEVVSNVVQSLEDYIAERGHRLSVDLPFTVVPVRGDATRLHQVVSNLMSNAVKFTDQGGEIRVTVKRQGEEAVLQVGDTGAGMTAALLPRVFDLFTQEDQGLARVKGGLGVGLTIVRNLVEMHGGKVEAHSEGPGKGSEFVVRLPVYLEGAPPQEPSAARSPDSQQPVRATDDVLASPTRLRVLVIEDNVDAAGTMGDLLQGWGYETRVVTDAERGLEAARELQPDVVLLDLGMPGMDGFEVAASLRQDFRLQGSVLKGSASDPGFEPGQNPEIRDLKSVTLIALTGYGQEEDRRRTREAGFDHHLTKPVAPDLLRALLGSFEGTR